jgi:predicted CXXCH cytochrome family protein
VLFSRYPYTWEGARRNADAGGSHISSGEARDFLLGGCSSALSCVACHDPHALDAPEKLRAFDTPARNDVCVGCHRDLAGTAAQRAHTHHDPNGAGAACLACHMPRKNMGLGYNLTRYHRIGSPTEPARVLGDRPLECALCHVDKTVGDLVTAMERFWGKRYDRALLLQLYGSLDASPLLATVVRGKAHEQATAIHVLGEHRVSAALAPIAAQLTNPYPLVRYYARQSLERIASRPCDVNLDQDDDKITTDATRWLSNTRLPQ